MAGLVDTDIIFKTTIYRLVNEFFSCAPELTSELATLSATRFVVKQKIIQKMDAQTAETSIKYLLSVIDQFQMLEPTEEETSIAENFEYFAATENLNLDCGESQLCAILISRGYTRIFTGDKRAIKAIEFLNKSSPVLGALENKVICFEQVIRAILDSVPLDRVRATICDNRDADKAMDICFCCRSESVSEQSVREGLGSYINHAIEEAPKVIDKTSM